MRKTLFWAAAAIAVVLGSALACLAGPEASACQVKHYTRGPEIDNGSGTVVWSGDGRSFVLTNEHVAPDPGRRCEVVLDGHTHPARWLRSDARADLALLLVDTELPAAEIASEIPARGTTLRQWGFPPASRCGRRPGPSSASAGRRAGLDVFETTIRSESGDSGSGVFEPSGKLVAVCWGGSYGHECCVSLAVVRAFLWPE